MSQLATLIPFIPLLGFIINGLGFPRIPKNVAGWIGCGSVFLSFLIVVSLFVQSITAGFESQKITLFQWIAAGSVNIGFDFYIDHLTLIMLLIVTGVGFLIHVYSYGYMHEDEGFGKFFAYLNLFIFFMLLLVMGAN
jgi:NADH-quinone oxidoreductase subunit L